MSRSRKWLIYGMIAVASVLFIYGSGYAATTYEETQEAIQRQHFPYKVIKQMVVWEQAEHAARYGYYLKKGDYVAISRLKSKFIEDVMIINEGSLLELINIAKTVILPQLHTNNIVTVIRVKGDLDCTYVDNAYFSFCTVYIGIGSNK